MFEIRADLSEKFSGIFSEEHDIEFKTTILTLMYDNMKDTYSRLVGSVKLLIILMVIFELILRASTAEVDIYGFKFKDISLVQKLFPIAISFMFYHSIVMFSFYNSCSRLYDCFIGSVAPLYGANYVNNFLTPPSPNNIYNLLDKISRGKILKGISTSIGAGFIILSFLGFPAFLLHSSYELLSVFGKLDIITWISIIVSFLLVIDAFIIFSITPVF